MQRQQVLVGGVRLFGERRLAAVVQQRRHVIGVQLLLHPLDERTHVRRLPALRVVVPVVQVVGDAARADQQHPVRAQRRQRAAHRPLVRGPQRRLDRQLQHRDVGLRVEQAQRQPGAVVEPALRIDQRRQSGRGQSCRHVLRQFRRAGRRVLQLVERLGKAAEIVDGPRPLRRRYHRRAAQPVRRGHHDGARRGQVARQLGQAHADLARMQGSHRRTMGDVQRRQAGHGILQLQDQAAISANAGSTCRRQPGTAPPAPAPRTPGIPSRRQHWRNRSRWRRAR